tara:strand:+ start:965 stop:1363 length:399 start_codon:yes stop_codon:yes gene_type:complete
MSYNAQIKEIHKLDTLPFGKNNDIYTYKVITTQHTGLFYTDNLKISKGDLIRYELKEQKNKVWQIVIPKDENKKPMYSNYTKQEQSVARLDTGRSILLQVAFKEASQAYIAGKISQDEVETLTNKYFNIIDK